MYKKPILTLVAIIIAAGIPVRADTEFFACSESGSGPNYFKVCVSDTGNVTLLESPKGQEHIRVPPIADPYVQSLHWGLQNSMEGFHVCRWPEWGGPSFAYSFDFGSYHPDAGQRGSGLADLGWEAPHRIDRPSGAGKFPLTVYRKTHLCYDFEGVWPPAPCFELKQEFSVDTAKRELAITMTLYSRVKWSQRNVSLVRVVDLDVDKTDLDDRAAFTGRSLIQFDGGPEACGDIGWPPEYKCSGGRRDAVSLTGLTPNYRLEVVDYRFLFDLEQLCDGYDGLGFLRTDEPRLTALAYRFGDLPPGASRTVKFVYRAY
ncbi:MAG: hypothetical protein KIT09_29245 [Bryobacteraceae bacterium]|nr:hypothetical protein [Bryobacteraceae bacterium]